MKHMDLFCASPASTAICSSMDQRATVCHRTRPIGRSHLLGTQPKKPLSMAPCICELPFDPKPFTNYQKSRKSSVKKGEMRRKSSTNIDDIASPLHSSRSPLSDTPFLEILSNSNTGKELVPSHKRRPPLPSSVTGKELVPSHKTRPPLPSSKNFDKTLTLKSSSTLAYSSQIRSNSSSSLKSSSIRPQTRHQVVELMVSIHCKGCEGKVRKHILRMEGVTSFSIDLESKKVTIVGDVTPLGVLASISRVKSAQFWPSPTSSPSSSSMPKLGFVTK